MLRKLWERHAIALDIALLLVIALAFRLWGIGFDLPNLYQPDEYLYVDKALRILKTGDYNLHFFNYPSLFFYVEAVAYVFYFLYCASRGVVKTVEGLIPPIEIFYGDVAFTRMPSQFLVGRGVTVLFALATVVLVYAIGRDLYNRRVGLVGGLALAVSFTHVRLSHFVSPDVFACCFVALAALLNYRITNSGRTRDYVMGGIAVGLAATTKYNAGVAIVLLIVAHLLRRDRSRLFDTNLAIGLGSCAVAFLAGSPYSLLDLPTFLNGVGFEMRHYSAPPMWPIDSAPVWYARYLLTREGLIALLAGIQILRSAVTRSKQGIYLSAFTLVYVLVISSQTVRNDRSLGPILPLTAILAGVLVNDILDAIWRRLGRAPEWGRGIIVVVVCGAMLGTSVSNTVALGRNLTKADVRTDAAAWVEQSLPPGSRIVVESYSPLMLSSTHRLELVAFATDHSIEWYRENADYIFLYSRNHYATVSSNPVAFARQMAEYQVIFDQFELVKEFYGPWVGLAPFWVRLYRVR